MTDVISPLLTPAEVDRLAACEDVIERGRMSFIEVGRALMEIKAAGLYRASHGTFEDYVKARWDMGRTYAYYAIEAADVAFTIVNAGSGPRTEGQVRPLLALRDRTDLLNEAWRLACEHAEFKDRPTGKEVRAAVAELLGTPVRPGVGSAPKDTLEEALLRTAIDGYYQMVVNEGDWQALQQLRRELPGTMTRVEQRLDKWFDRQLRDLAPLMTGAEKAS
jgi:hypothetical protein